MNAKNPKFAIAPKKCQHYLTPSKKYPIINFGETTFNINSDGGRMMSCRTKQCAHLYGGNWILRNK